MGKDINDCTRVIWSWPLGSLHPGHQSSQERGLPRAADAQYTQDARTSLVVRSGKATAFPTTGLLKYESRKFGDQKVWRFTRVK